MDLLKGACTLPIIGRVVKHDDKELLDGGITKMIPIEESIKDNRSIVSRTSFLRGCSSLSKAQTRNFPSIYIL